MDVVDAKKLFKDALNELLSRKVHGYQQLWQIYARKPETTS